MIDSSTGFECSAVKSYSFSKVARPTSRDSLPSLRPWRDELAGLMGETAFASPGAKVDYKVRRLMADNPRLDYEAAFHQVLASDAQLKHDYAEWGY